MHFIGIDLGTSGIKGGVIDRQGKILASAYVDTTFTSRRPGEMEQSIEDLLLSTLSVIRDVVIRSGVAPATIGGIALDGQMGGVIGIGKDFSAITGLDMNLDLRSQRYSVRMHEDLGETLTRTTCGSPLNGQKILWWKGEHPDTYRRILKFVTVSGYVAARMAGLRPEEAFIDFTLLSFFGLEDARGLCWSEEMCRGLSIDIGKLPAVVSPCARIGDLSARASAATGLRRGTPLFAGCGDQSAGFLGLGIDRPGTIVDVSGSTTLIFRCSEEFVPDIEHRSVMFMPSVNGKTYNAFTYINGGGISLPWLLDDILTDHAVEKQDDKYDLITEQARQIPAGSDGLFFIPYLGGRQCPFDVKMRGGWLGLNWGHKRGHLYRSVLESIAYESRKGLDLMQDLFGPPASDAVVVTGGGAKNELWNQIKADVLGYRYESVEGYDSALRGCAMIVAKGAGAFPDWQSTIAGLKRREVNGVFSPDVRKRERYREYCRLYGTLLEKSLREIMQMLTDIREAQEEGQWQSSAPDEKQGEHNG